jgi:ribonucleoside-diphosphate reductase alpha chain
MSGTAIRDADRERSAQVGASISTGLVRGRVGETLSLISGGRDLQPVAEVVTSQVVTSQAAQAVAGATHAVSDQPAIAVAAVAAAPVGEVLEPAPPSTDASRRLEARMKGYEGESCAECGNFTMVRNGTCLKCDTCGSTSGCS